ncbi:MAG: RsmB/NOP family class I SAM-dependent RNA methyltransferase [Ignavibacteria bacterium]|nr:RsmB/NOP family class I SAM-dependent RNA methyltransferase [Ignavibacteria bacterium]
MITPKIHQNLLEAVDLALKQIFFDGYFADKVIQRVLKSNKKWGAQDRRFIAETTYDIVRNWRFYNEISGSYLTEKPESTPVIIAIHLYTRFKSDHPYVRKFLPAINIGEKITGLRQIRAIRESVPDWLDEFGLAELHNNWEDELSALNKQAEVIIRTNTLKTDRQELQRRLFEENIDTIPCLQNEVGLQLVNRVNLFTSKTFKSGLFEVQDISSQEVAIFTNPQPGERIIDACAGGGGKSLHLACLMQNKGKIIGMDTESRKLEELQDRAKRDGISIIETRAIDSQKVVKRLAGSADKVLLDVPCSGSGVIRRNPDAKWKLSLEKIANLKQIQRQILGSYWQMVKPGGTMVYSTCSLFPSENREQIDWFLQEKPEFELIEDRSFSPFRNNSDGFYMAKLIRKN